MKVLYVGGPINGQERDVEEGVHISHPVLQTRQTLCFGRDPMVQTEYHWPTYYRYRLADGCEVFVHESVVDEAAIDAEAKLAGKVPARLAGLAAEYERMDSDGPGAATEGGDGDTLAPNVDQNADTDTPKT
jgi:hypothetical protein